ncbi:SDR family NAD(P)-dependent oxidoreductase [Hylemonella gracilis]|uniref:SDR family NAD(P)-dependent oxidoreductase n=1 Tax=Hylemonella gracilis TaxID=80880 RepID=A0A4P6UJV0_9BURK|nr:SDR family NAD(P)-dependent oxidoreductase [Hylemonella gracilis]QBK04355.1 SDR family NAD(P)-dependent oxidoreductase [Hylemonella gracilis]
MNEKPSINHSSSPKKWVLITGGAQRLGRILCLAFARDGWGVVCHYRHSDAPARALQVEIESLGGTCRTVQADLADTEDATNLVDRATGLAQAGLECIINNASEFEADSAADFTPEQLLRAFTVNTMAPLLLTQGFFRQVRQRTATPGCVIHVLDQKVHNLNPDYFSYTLSKLALERAVALQAQAYAPHLRVCGISPGLSFVSGPQTEDNFERARRVNLLRQPLNPEHVAQAALHLAQNLALNGCVLPVDNGQHQLPLARDVMYAIDLGLTPR